MVSTKRIHNDCRDHFIGGLLYNILKDPWKASVIRRLEILADGHQRCEHFEYDHDQWGAQDLLTKKMEESHVRIQSCYKRGIWIDGNSYHQDGEMREDLSTRTD